MESNHVKIGTVVSKHGFKGSIKVNLLSIKFKNVPDIDFIFIDIDNCFVPFKVDNIGFSNDKCVIFKLQEINSDNEASEVISKSVYLDKKYSKSIDKEDFLYDEFLNFLVYKDSKKIGKIVNVISSLPQPVFEILIDDKKFMVPIHNDFIEKIDRENKCIFLLMPDGLLEIT